MEAESPKKARSRLEKQGVKKSKKRGAGTRLAYRKHAIMLIPSLAFFVVVGYIFLNISPSSIAHIPLPNSYLLLLIPLFLAQFFLFAFVFLNSRRGALLALLTTLLVFFKLQQLVFENFWLGPLLISFVIIEIAASIKDKLLNSEKTSRHHTG